MTIDELLARYSPVTFYATDRGVRLDFGFRSFPGRTVDEAINLFLSAMEHERQATRPPGD